MTDEKKHEPWTFLAVTITQSGTNLIELVGLGTGYDYCERRIPPHVIDDIEKEITKAAKALENYKRASDKNERITRAQFEARATA